jgi:hypothetical protein
MKQGIQRPYCCLYCDRATGFNREPGPHVAFAGYGDSLIQPGSFVGIVPQRIEPVGGFFFAFTEFNKLIKRRKKAALYYGNRVFLNNLTFHFPSFL